MDELKDAVLQSLDSNGTLDAIRAQLRSNVFKVIAGQKQSERSDSAKIIEHEFGLIAIELFTEFLELNDFSNTLSVFLQEAQAPEVKPLSQVESRFGVKRQPGKPLISQVIQRANQSPTVMKAVVAPKKPEPRVVKAEPIAEIPAFRPQKRDEKPKKPIDEFDFWGADPPKTETPFEEAKKKADVSKPEPIKLDPFKDLKIDNFTDKQSQPAKEKLPEPVKERPKLEPIKDKPVVEPIKEKPKTLDPLPAKPETKESKAEPLPPLFSRSKPGLRLPSFEDDSNEGEKARLAKLEKDLAAIEAKEKAGKVVDIHQSDDYSEEFDE